MPFMVQIFSSQSSFSLQVRSKNKHFVSKKTASLVALFLQQN